MIYGKNGSTILLHHSKTIPQGNDIGFQINIIAFGLVIRKVRLYGAGPPKILRMTSMTKNTRFTSHGFRLAVLALAIAGSGSANAATATASATGTLISPINITKGADLVFGNLAASALAGTVTLTPGGGRTGDANVTALTGVTPAAARFDVTGQAGLGYSISVTASALTANAGVDTMAFTPVSDLSASAITSGSVTVGTLTGGAQSIYVGGVLSVGASQAPGDYSGVITALVNYN